MLILASREEYNLFFLSYIYFRYRKVIICYYSDDLVLVEVTTSAELRQELGCKLFMWEMMPGSRKK